jgi:serine/threonine protein kinase
VACVDENTLTAYFGFRLTPEETTRLFDHLDGCAACAQLFHDVAAALTSQHSLPRTVPAPQDPGPTLGRYRIDRMLGMGGMGVVYAGFDPQLERKVAIKLLQPDSKITLRAPLMREAQAMAQLSHPNVINVYEVGTFGEQVFVVMELIEGSTLAGWLAEKERSWREIVDAFVAAGAGLEAAHRAGIIHRDFKPDNVLVGKDGRICVTDFGLARRIEVPEESAAPSPVSEIAPTITRSGLLVGTPAYMAPEQMRAEPTDERTDIFSFCVALYEALYGTRPFLGKNLEQLREAIEAQAIQPPKRLRGPAAYRRVIERGLKPEPSDRPSSLSQLLSVLRVDPLARRRRVLAVVAALFLLGTSLAVTERSVRRSRMCTGGEKKLAGIWDFPRRELIHTAFTHSGLRSAQSMWAATERALNEYARELVNMQTSACEATRVQGVQSEELLDLRMQCLDDRIRELRALTDLLAGGDEAVIKAADRSAGALSSIPDCADSEALRAGAKLPSDPKLRSQVLQLKDKAARAKALYDLDKYSDALAVASEVVDNNAAQLYPPVRGQALLVRGKAERLLNRIDEARRDDSEAAQIGLRHRDDSLLAGSWLERATLAANQKRFDEALEWNQQTAAVIGRMGSDSLESRRLQSLGYIYMASGQLPKAEEAARQALSLAERSLPSSDRAVAVGCDVLGSVLFYQGRFSDALPIYQRALALYERAGDADILGASSAGTNLGSTFAYLHRYGEAAAAVENGLRLRERIFDPDSVFIADALLSLAGPLCKLKRFDEASVAIERLAQIVEKNRETLAEAVGQVLWLRGEVALGRGQVDVAVRLLEEAVSDKALPPVPRAQAEYALGRALWDRDPKRARTLAANAKADSLRDQPPDPILATELEHWLAEHTLP